MVLGAERRQCGCGVAQSRSGASQYEVRRSGKGWCGVVWFVCGVRCCRCGVSVVWVRWCRWCGCGGADGVDVHTSWMSCGNVV